MARLAQGDAGVLHSLFDVVGIRRAGCIAHGAWQLLDPPEVLALLIA